MQWLIRFLKSSLGAKVLMALSGAALSAFVLAHMTGNLLVFAGPDALNAYAAQLKATGLLLWIARGGLLGVFLLHIAAGFRLKYLNRMARPERYARSSHETSSFAGRNMIISGAALLAFVGYHLAHFTLGTVQPEFYSGVDQLNRHDVYSMVVQGFQVPMVTGLYVVAMILLGLHLSHGVSSMFQSIGVRTPKYQGLIDKLGPIFAAIIVAGNISMPVAIVSGAIKLGA